MIATLPAIKTTDKCHTQIILKTDFNQTFISSNSTLFLKFVRLIKFKN